MNLGISELVIVFAVLFLLIFVTALIARLWMLAAKRLEEPRASRALEILNERYARGEISREQFEQMKDDVA
jgi:putative membrane protein